jgi:hypothetical protein
MTLAAIQTAFDAELLDYQAHNPIEVAWENTVYNPVEGVAYLATRMSARVQTVRGTGANGTVEWSGTYQISVFGPIGEGMWNVATMADGLRLFFRRGTTLLTVDGLSVLLDTPTVPPAIEQPNWVMLPVLVNWFCYETPS